MPKYDYKCTACNKQHEIIHGFYDSPSNCPCGGKLTKLYHPAMIVFNGKGFYSTDK